MTSPDMRSEQRGVIEFRVAEIVNPIDIHRRLISVYGYETLDITSVRCRMLRIKGSESHYFRSGSTPTASNGDRRDT